MFDVAIVGGGPAGLSAALVLGRSQRSVVVFDSGEYRNAATLAVHGFLTRDGTPPTELRRLGRAQLAPYDVQFLRDPVLSAVAHAGEFRLVLGSGKVVGARKLVLAAGVTDVLPAIRGLDDLWGKSVFLCPYCDGWEFRRRPLGVLGPHGAQLAATLRCWSEQVALFTDGRTLSATERVRLRAAGVEMYEARVVRLAGHHGVLEAVELAGGEHVERRALFLKLPPPQLSPLVAAFGLQRRGEGVAHEGSRTAVPGLFVAGDLSRDDLRFAITAAADGVIAAVAANRELADEAGFSVL